MRARVRIISGAAQQILDHPDILNEEVVTSIVLSVPAKKRTYYDSKRFTITAKRKTKGGIWKSILIRVEENLINPLPGSQNESESEFVVLLIHVESI